MSKPDPKYPEFVETKTSSRTVIDLCTESNDVDDDTVDDQLDCKPSTTEEKIKLERSDPSLFSFTPQPKTKPSTKPSYTIERSFTPHNKTQPSYTIERSFTPRNKSISKKIKCVPPSSSLSKKKRKGGKLKIGKMPEPDATQPTLTQAFWGGAERIDPSAFITTEEAIVPSGRDNDIRHWSPHKKEAEIAYRNSKLLCDRTAEGWSFCEWLCFKNDIFRIS